MNQLTCQAVDEMLAAYAADALEPDEQLDTATHLAECRNHDRALQALREGFAQLATGVPTIEPPASLRASLLDAFDREASVASRLETEPAPVTPRSAPHRLVPAAWFGYALAAALLVVAIGLGAWGASRGADDAGIQVITTQDAGGTLQLTYLPRHGLGVIDVDLAPLDTGQAYQAWRIDATGTATSLGVLPSTQGRFALDDDLEGASLVALSVEPAGGSQSPTSDPILVTSLN